MRNEKYTKKQRIVNNISKIGTFKMAKKLMQDKQVKRCVKNGVEYVECWIKKRR